MNEIYFSNCYQQSNSYELRYNTSQIEREREREYYKVRILESTEKLNLRYKKEHLLQ